MKISVILTAYNAAAYLREALDSILAQEHKDWEAICVDDGSTDETGSILDEYARRQSNNQTIPNQTIFKIIHQANKGASAARNTGLVLATGDYITFCDADDVLSPYWFSNAVTLIAETKPDMLRARLHFAREMPADFAVKRTAHIKQVLSGQQECLKWSWDVLFPFGYAVLAFIRADLKPFVRFPDQLRVKEDSTMLVNLAPHLTRIVQSDYCGYFYRNTQGSLLRGKRKAQASVLYLRALMEIWERQRIVAGQLGLLDDLRRTIQKVSDEDVVDWAIVSAPESRRAKLQVREAWSLLRKLGVHSGGYCHRAFLYLPFLWWRITGRETMIKLTWNLFLVVRKVVVKAIRRPA